MIKGSLVGLRAIEEADLPLLKEWRNIESFRDCFREFRELNLENQKAWFNALTLSKNDFMFGIVDLKSSKLIGACGLLYVNWVVRFADFSFYLGANDAYVGDEEGKSAEATNLLLGYGYNTLNLHKIWMELFEFDEKKLTFFKQNFGFSVDGVLRDNCFHNGEYYNSNILSLLSSEFVKQFDVDV